MPISLFKLSEDHSSLMFTYYQIAQTYYQLKNYEQALRFYQKTLNIEMKILPDNDKAIATSYKDISLCYLFLEDFDCALFAASQAHEQLMKIYPFDHQEMIQIREFLNRIKVTQIVREK